MLAQGCYATQMANDTVGDRIHSRRVERGLTQSELAKEAGLAEAVSVSRYERGAARPSADTLLALARVLRCSVKWLAGGAS